jgi:hypothetical protein
VSGQLHGPAALTPRKEPPVPIGKKAGWALEPVWTTWRKENSLPYRDSNSDPSVVQPVASRYTDYAIPAPYDCVVRWNSTDVSEEHVRLGHAVAQAVSRSFPTAAARVRVRASMWGLWWTKRHWGRFSPSTSVFPCQSSFHKFLHDHNHPGLAQ